MGCDIHIHAEVKVRGTWHHYGNYRPFRWYLAFGLMTGVRGDQELFGPPRGLPKDVSETTRLLHELDGEDAHSASWLGPQEIEQLAERLASLGVAFTPQTCYLRRSSIFQLEDLDQWVGGYLFGNGWNRESLRDYEDVTHFRWVFWFDN